MKKMNIVRSLSLVFVLWISATEAEMRGVEEGKKTFDEKRCMVCHSLGWAGGAQAKLGGPLDDVGNKRDAAWLKALLTDPQISHPFPKQGLTDKEREDLITYLLSLKQ